MIFITAKQAEALVKFAKAGANGEAILITIPEDEPGEKYTRLLPGGQDLHFTREGVSIRVSTTGRKVNTTHA